MRTIIANKQISDKEADKMRGVTLTDDSYDIVVSDETTQVLKEDGTPLLILIKGAVMLGDVQKAYPSLRHAAVHFKSDNRGSASGRFLIQSDKYIGKFTDTTWRPLLKNGQLSSTSKAIASDEAIRRIREAGGKIFQEMSDGRFVEYLKGTPPNAVAGYMDASPRFPYCRLTAFNINHPDLFKEALPMIHAADCTFAEYLPERYAVQKAEVEQTAADFYITGTVFTTLTINLDFQTAVHKDAGDLQAGFGVMSVIRAGKYKGAYTVFPQYRVAADMETGDILLADVHEWHGNSPKVDLEPTAERLSLVFYYREKMRNCKPISEELQKVKKNRGNTHLKGLKFNE